MPSSNYTNHIDFQNVKIKAESFAACTEDMESTKCVYDLIFEAIEPTDDQKLKLLNNLIAKETDADELRKYHMNRAHIFFNMRQWNNVFDDIDYVEQYGALDGKMSILKIKATIQYELEKSRQIINKTISDYVVDSYEERIELSKTIEQIDEIIERIFISSFKFLILEYNLNGLFYCLTSDDKTQIDVMVNIFLIIL